MDYRGRGVMDKLTAWLVSEAEVLAGQDSLDDFEAGYLGAITNTLDFLQGAQVYIQSMEESNA
jgi:hypothetical protein